MPNKPVKGKKIGPRGRYVREGVIADGVTDPVQKPYRLVGKQREGVLAQFNLADPDQLLKALEQFEFNQSWLAEVLGLGPGAITNRLKRYGLQEKVKQLRNDLKARKAGRYKPNTIQSHEKAASEVVAEIQMKWAAVRRDVREAYAQHSEEVMADALVASGGSIKDASIMLGIDYELMLRVVGKSERLQDARDYGEEEFRHEARDMVLDAVRGRLKLTAEQSKWLMFYAKAKLDMNETIHHTTQSLDAPIPDGPPKVLPLPKRLDVPG